MSPVVSPVGAVLALAALDELDDDGWLACTAAGFGERLETLRAVFEGAASTRTLGEPSAVALLDRTRDRNLVDPADLRSDVLATVAEFAPDIAAPSPLTPELVAESLSEDLVTGVGDTPKHVLYRLGRACDSARNGCGDEVFAAAVVLCFAEPDRWPSLDLSRFNDCFVVAQTVLNRRASLATAFLERLHDMGEVQAAAFTAAVASSFPAFVNTYCSLESLRSAWRCAAAEPVDRSSPVCEADSSEMLRSGAHLQHISTMFVLLDGALFGAGSLAELWGFPACIDDVSVGQAGELLEVARDCPEATAPFLDVWTSGGSVIRPIPGRRFPPHPRREDQGVACAGVWRSALAATDPTVDPRQFTERAIHWVCAPDSDGEALLAAIAERDELHRAFLTHLPSALRWVHETPDYLGPVVEESMNVIGLCTWVDCVGSARVRLARAGAGIGASRWATVVSMLAGFRGTPEELVALSGELAPQR